MKRISRSQRQLLAEFLSNIAVGWFAGGVIGIFIGGIKPIHEIALSISWGIILSLTFLLFGLAILRQK